MNMTVFGTGLMIVAAYLACYYVWRSIPWVTVYIWVKSWFTKHRGKK